MHIGNGKCVFAIARALAMVNAHFPEKLASAIVVFLLLRHLSEFKHSVDCQCSLFISQH